MHLWHRLPVSWIWEASVVGSEEVGGSHVSVVADRVVFGEVVSQISGGSIPKHSEMVLGDSVLNPPEAHVHGFGPFLFYQAVGKASGYGIVRHDVCGRLGVAHLF